MFAIELPVTHVDEALRVVKALGAHRYVAGRMHLVHAFALRAAGLPFEIPADVDVASRDERMWRRATEAEVIQVLEAFWRPGEARQAAHQSLRAALDEADLPLSDAPPFDEDAEEDIHPLLVDAGWELLKLSELDRERHRGAIEAFGDSLLFDAAMFEESEAIPPRLSLQELPGIGPVELLSGADDEGRLVCPFVLWCEGDETYQDYVIRGVQRAAKIG